MRAASWGSAPSLCSCSVAQLCILVPLWMLDKDSFVGLCKPLLFPYPALVLGIMQLLSTRVSSQGKVMCPGGTDPARPSDFGSRCSRRTDAAVEQRLCFALKLRLPVKTLSAL